MAAPEKPALQIERTQLSWERTAVSLLAVAVTLLVHRTGQVTWDRAVLSAIAALVALAVLWTARRRGRHQPRPDPTGRLQLPAYGRAIALLGGLTAILALVIAVTALRG